MKKQDIEKVMTRVSETIAEINRLEARFGSDYVAAMWPVYDSRKSLKEVIDILSSYISE